MSSLRKTLSANLTQRRVQQLIWQQVLALGLVRLVQEARTKLEMRQLAAAVDDTCPLATQMIFSAKDGLQSPMFENQLNVY